MIEASPAGSDGATSASGTSSPRATCERISTYELHHVVGTSRGVDARGAHPDHVRMPAAAPEGLHLSLEASAPLRVERAVVHELERVLGARARVRAAHAVDDAHAPARDLLDDL